jgi:putative ABC transport system permease protein
MDDVVGVSVAPRRTPMLLISTFAATALLLSMIGIYGVTAYYVTQRTHQIGIRMALGAQLSDVLKLVLKRGVILAAIGIGVGLVGAIALTRLIATLLVNVKPIDTVTFVTVS